MFACFQKYYRRWCGYTVRGNSTNFHLTGNRYCIQSITKIKPLSNDEDGDASGVEHDVDDGIHRFQRVFARMQIVLYLLRDDAAIEVVCKNCVQFVVDGPLNRLRLLIRPTSAACSNRRMELDVDASCSAAWSLRRRWTVASAARLDRVHNLDIDKHATNLKVVVVSAVQHLYDGCHSKYWVPPRLALSQPPAVQSASAVQQVYGRCYWKYWVPPPPLAPPQPPPVLKTSNCNQSSQYNCTNSTY